MHLLRSSRSAESSTSSGNWNLLTNLETVLLVELGNTSLAGFLLALQRDLSILLVDDTQRKYSTPMEFDRCTTMLDNLSTSRRMPGKSPDWPSFPTNSSFRSVCEKPFLIN